MTTGKLSIAGILFLSLAGCTTQTGIEKKKPQIAVRGVAGLIAGSPRKPTNHVPVAPDPNFIPYKRKPRGQVRFEMPLEPNFKPSPKFEKPLPRKDSSDPVSKVIEMKLDPDRSNRIARLVEQN